MSKKRQDNWQLCELCGRLFYSRHLSDHRAICEGNSTTESLKQAYIQDGVLHAVVIERNSKMLSGKARNIDNYDLFSAEISLVGNESPFFGRKSTRSFGNITRSSRQGGVATACGPFLYNCRILDLIVSITKFSIVIGPPHAYLSRNRRAITWVSYYKCPI